MAMNGWSEEFHSWARDCHKLWAEWEKMPRLEEARVPERSEFRRLLERGVIVYRRLRAASRAEDQSKLALLEDFYSALLGLLAVSGAEEEDERDRKIRDSLASDRLFSVSAISGAFGESMGGLLKVLDSVRLRPRASLASLERLQEAAFTLSGWQGKFSPEKTSLIGVLKIWSRDLLNRKILDGTPIVVEFLTKELPFPLAKPVELHLLVVSETPLTPVVLVQPEGEKTLERVDGSGGSVSWDEPLMINHTQQEEGWRTRVFDFKVMVRGIRNVMSLPIDISFIWQLYPKDQSGRVVSGRETVKFRNGEFRASRVVDPDAPARWVEESRTRIVQERKSYLYFL